MNCLSRVLISSILLGLLVPIGLARADGMMPCTREAMQSDVSPFAVDGRTASFMEQAGADVSAERYDSAIRRLLSARNRADREAGASCVAAEISARLVQVYLGRADAIDAQITQVGASGGADSKAQVEALRADARQALRDARTAQADYARRTGGVELRSVSWSLDDVRAPASPAVLAGTVPEEAGSSWQRITGWTSIGVGVAAVAAGGFLYRETKHIDQRILDLELPQGDRYQSMLEVRSRTLLASNITVGVGVALIGAGALALVFDDGEPPRDGRADVARVHFGLDRVALEVKW